MDHILFRDVAAAGYWQGHFFQAVFFRNATLADAKKYLDNYPTVTECPTTISTIQQAFEIDDIPELHDRLIAATGKEFGTPILTNDPDMHASKYVQAIWKP